MPTVIDGTDNRVASTYGGWPDRLYLVDTDGRIAYQGGEGPFGFKPDELAAAIERLPVHRSTLPLPLDRPEHERLRRADEPGSGNG